MQLGFLIPCFCTRETVNNYKQTLARAAVALRIPKDRASELNETAGLEVFENSLGRALEDGVLDQKEAEQLRRVASSLESSTGGLVRKYFSQQAAGFLRGLFLAATQDGQILENSWQRLRDTTARFGLTWDEFLAMIQGQAQQFVEHTLADAKADELISPDEDAMLTWLLQELHLPPLFMGYVEQELSELRLFTNIKAGKLPSLAPPPRVELRSGEITHYHGIAKYRVERRLKSGPRINEHSGTITITDYRSIFDSPTSSFSLIHSRIVSLDATVWGIEIRSGSKGGGTYDFGPKSRLVFALLQTAVRRANQTIVEKQEGLPTRHIPRDVRQRVWQKYAARCAECGSNQYLEFDHIIPVAHGGSNSDSNVQLLCRRCNLKKSDMI